MQGLSEVIAAFLMETSAGPILFETGPHSTYQHLVSGIQQNGFEISDIRHVFLTHIHLDHAGAAWKLAQHGCKVYVHPLGAKHIADPSRLMASAKRIYKEQMDSLWGRLEPISKENLVIVEDQETIKIGNAPIKAHHTPGHAIHHITWQIEDNAITGDVAGVKIGNGIVVPPCPPPDINIELWQASIEHLRKLNLSKLYLTHFGQYSDVKIHLDELEQRLLNWANWIKPYWQEKIPAERVIPHFVAFVEQQFLENGMNQQAMAQYDSANPAWMSVAGLMRYWEKHVKA